MPRRQHAVDLQCPNGIELHAPDKGMKYLCPRCRVCAWSMSCIMECKPKCPTCEKRKEEEENAKEDRRKEEEEEAEEDRKGDLQ